MLHTGSCTCYVEKDEGQEKEKERDRGQGARAKVVVKVLEQFKPKHTLAIHKNKLNSECNLSTTQLSKRERERGRESVRILTVGSVG